MLPISSVKKYGLNHLINLIEKSIISSTRLKRAILRVETGSTEFKWLMDNISVYNIEVDSENGNYSRLHALVQDFQIEQFKKFVQKA
jgi:hypothetical protein